MCDNMPAPCLPPPAMLFVYSYTGILDLGVSTYPYLTTPETVISADKRRV